MKKSLSIAIFDRKILFLDQNSSYKQISSFKEKFKIDYLVT